MVYLTYLFQNHANYVIHSVQGGAMKPNQDCTSSQGKERILQEDSQCDKIPIFTDNLFLEDLMDF